MTLAQLLIPNRIQLNAEISSKKTALQELSRLFAESDNTLDQNLVFDALTDREKLGSTALEQGIAIPHCRISGCTQAQSAILTLRTGIDFDARDGQAVDLLWALIVPEQSTDEHLAILAQLANTLSSADNCRKIRASRNAEELHQNLTALEQMTEQQS
jgi:PTS system nitrogen regulatory IIA component